MKIKEQTRKLSAGCSKHCFEVVDRDTGKKGFKIRKFALFSPQIEFLPSLNSTHGKATLTWF